METTIDYKYLRLISNPKFNLWDVKRYRKSSSLTFENIVRLSDILTPYKNNVSKEEMIKNDWQIIKKINFGGELFLRDKEEINTYKGKLNLVPENALIYSKINVRHGCIYFNEKGSTPFGVSTEYPTFLFDETKINGFFLKKVLRSEEFKKLLNTKTSGISKARVKQDEFLSIEIPLPSLAEQDIIITAYQKEILKAKKLEKKAQNLEEEIEKYFLEQMGIDKIEEITETKKGLQLFQFADLDRWDAWVNKIQTFSGKYKPIKFGDIILGKPIYGANVKGVKKESDTRYIRITDINEDGTLNNAFVSPEFVEEKYLLKENDFLIARSGNTVGKTFLYKEKYGRAIYAGYLVNYHLDFSKVLPEYVLAYTKSYSFKQWISSNQRVAGQPNINGQEYLQAPILVPSLDIQKTIVTKINLLKAKIHKTKTQIENLKQNAETEFEKSIFN